ncbi:hypothetical protein OsI_19847 [Oryza sativa Indica Group]|uniref:Uncharacterized protein n=1 Tax=Oryza sativa subsp. indica TaxID=39946 RepID=A2Y4C1_ORYSI|nr:hypothetical protein OsI_19847 [Oryza sativa Indica Group]
MAMPRSTPYPFPNPPRQIWPELARHRQRQRSARRDNDNSGRATQVTLAQVTTVGDWRQEVNAGDGKEAALADIVGGQRGDDKKGDDDSVPQRAVFESFLVKTMSWFSLRSQGKVASVLIVTLLSGDVV